MLGVDLLGGCRRAERDFAFSSFEVPELGYPIPSLVLNPGFLKPSTHDVPFMRLRRDFVRRHQDITPCGRIVLRKPGFQALATHELPSAHGDRR